MIRPPASRVPDAELLARFVRHRDEAAFELLVWRYHRLVAGVCRRTVGDRHAAEDAAQAAFLALARRADRLHDGAALPGWLARVAYRCAVKVRANRKASRPREGTEVRARPPSHPGDGSPGDGSPFSSPEDLELFAALDAELDRLPDRLRLPVVLCHLDGRTYADAATALGIPVGTLSGRLTRARALLKDRLTRRGFAPLAVPAAVVTVDASRVAAVTRAAVAFAAGDPPVSPSTPIAVEVLRAMSVPKLLTGSVAGLVLSGVAVVGLAVARPTGEPPKPAGANPAARPTTDADRLQGEWLFESATDENGNDALGPYRDSRLVFRKNTVAVSKSPYSEATIETTFTLDPAAVPKRMDWVVPKFYQTLLGLPAGTVRGIYEFDGDALRVCMANRPGGGPRTAPPGGGEKPVAEVVPFGPRPTEFKADREKGHFLFAVRRWTGKPGAPLTEATVTVLDPEGKPAAGAEVFGMRWRNADSNAGEWIQYGESITGVDGRSTIKLDDIGRQALTARHPGRGLIGFVATTPAGLHHGLSVRLAPEVRVSGRLASPELANAGTDFGWANVYLASTGGRRTFWSGDAGYTGRFEFLAPPGEYELDCYGERMARRRVRLTVPAGKPEFDAGTVELPATDWGKLVGKPAPELRDVDGWAGDPVTLAGLKGRVVLLYFWSAEFTNTHVGLPGVIAAANKYRDRGLRAVGVHTDPAGEVLTAEAFDRATAKLKADKWGSKDLPFPVALTVGDAGFDIPGFIGKSRGRAMADYGVTGMTLGGGILIDRKGVVRGLYNPGLTRAEALLDELLAE